MTNLTTTYSKNKLNENMLEELELDIQIKDNPFEFELGDLFLVGARRNPKRNFLFVSQLIGKHISVNPSVPLLSGYLLSALMMQKLENRTFPFKTMIANAIKGEDDPKEIYDICKSHRLEVEVPTLVLGFAETATGLGHASFHALKGNVEYIHTTREDITNLKSSFAFEEEHSHATSHMCFGMEKDYFAKFDRIVLVDDEITTGNTVLNLIESLNKHFPNKEYSVLSILDWRQPADLEKYEVAQEKLGVSIEVFALLSGEVYYSTKQLEYAEAQYEEVPNYELEISTHYIPAGDNALHMTVRKENGEVTAKSYHKGTGRFGLNHEGQMKLEEEMEYFGGLLKSSRQSDKTLCLGTGEYMFMPCLLASHMGEGVVYHSTTRSPIYTKTDTSYPVNIAVPYTNPEDESVKYYLYNIRPNQYEEVFMFWERDVEENFKDYLAMELTKLGVKHLHFVVFEYATEGCN